MENKQKIPHIKIDGEIYDEINVTTADGDLIASIGPEDVIEVDGYKVTFVKHKSVEKENNE